MSRFCEQCGTPLEPNENFCSSCGAKVIRDEPTYTPPVNQPSKQQTYTPPKSTPVESTSKPAAENHMGKFLSLIGILVLIGVVAYFANKPDTTPKPYNTSWTVNNAPPNYQGVLEKRLRLRHLQHRQAKVRLLE